MHDAVAADPGCLWQSGCLCTGPYGTRMQQSCVASAYSGTHCGAEGDTLLLSLLQLLTDKDAYALILLLRACAWDANVAAGHGHGAVPSGHEHCYD